MSQFSSLTLEVYASIHPGFMAGNCIINPFLIIFYQFFSSFCLGKAQNVLLKTFCFYCLIILRLSLILAGKYIFLYVPFHLLANLIQFCLISAFSNSSFYLLNLIMLFLNFLFVILIKMQFRKILPNPNLLYQFFPILGIKLQKFH